MPKPYLLSEINWKTVQSTSYQLAILPWGATEAHNYHLPYATDNYQVEHIAKRAAAKAWAVGTPLILLPLIPFGVQSGQLDIPLCMHLNPSTQLAILRDTVDTLKRHGIHKMVILNGHGGNNFKTMIRELSVSHPEVFVCSVDWFKIGDQSMFFEEEGDHADEMETSAMLHIRPDLVRPLSAAGDGATKQYRIKGFKDGWATAQRPWTTISQDTGTGNPKKATAEKGAAYLDEVVKELSDFFVELAKNESLFV
ncbi:MAG: creatininase family protein [Bacteroidota bacterium]